MLTDERVEDNVAVPIGAPFRGDHITSQLQFDPSKIRQEYSKSLRKMLLFGIERLVNCLQVSPGSARRV